MVVSGFLLFILDMLSLYQLNLLYGVGWAFAAFFIVPAQIFVPFLVGTWVPMIILAAIFFFGGYIATLEEKK